MSVYEMFYLSAIVGGAAVMISEGRRRGFETSRWLPAVVLWVLGGMIGAELPHMILGDVAATRTAVGAVAGATLALFAGALIFRIPSGAALDTTALAIPIGGALARLGCFAADCCVGLATNLPVGIVGDDGVRRHPAQLYEASFDLAVAAWISRRTSKAADGHRFLVSLGLMSIGRFAIEFLRESEKFGPLSLAQWVVGPFAITCFVGVGLRVRFPQVKAGAPRLAAAGMTALMLQMPAPADSTFPQRFAFWGIGFGHGGYRLEHENIHSCDAPSTNEWSRFHKYFGGSVEGGYLRQGSQWSGVSFRGRASYSVDFADRPVASRGTAPNPRRYRTTNLSAGGFVDLTGRYAAITLGGTAGIVRPALAGLLEGEHDPIDAWPAYPGVALRLGPLFGPSAEFRFGDEVPLNVPLPLMSLSIGGGDRHGNRIRLGVSDGGYFAAATIKRPKGLEILGSFYLLTDPILQRQGGGVAVRQWIKLPPLPRR